MNKKKKGPKKIKKGKYITVDYISDEIPLIKETAYGTFTFPGKRVMAQVNGGLALSKNIEVPLVGYFFMANGKILRKAGSWAGICGVAGRLDYPNFLGAEFYEIDRDTFKETRYEPSEDDFEEFVRSIPKALQKHLVLTNHTDKRKTTPITRQ